MREVTVAGNEQDQTALFVLAKSSAVYAIPVRGNGSGQYLQDVCGNLFVLIIGMDINY